MVGKHIAIVLAAGQGKRMQTKEHKQYLLLGDKPILYYSLKIFEDSFVDEVVLVTGIGEEDYCRKEILEKYNLTKVQRIVSGGKERYHSVANALRSIEGGDYIYIHDAARPFLTQEILVRARECVEKYQACVVGMPVKDTIKITDEEGFISTTPNRNLVWMVQTPQVFTYSLIKDAYATLMLQEQEIIDKKIVITDDAMVVETLTGKKIKCVEGSYENIKITTPEDLKVGKIFLKQPI